MFEIKYDIEQQTVMISGQFDASRANECKELLGSIDKSITIDMSGLEYICSAGIGILVMNYSRLKDLGEKIYLTNLNDHIKKVFKISLLDKVFEIR